MIRILHSVSNMDRAGIETMLMNYYRHIDRNQVQFDFLCNKTKPGAYDDEVQRLGGRIYHTPGLNPAKYPLYLKYMKKLFAEHPEYKIVEAHNGALGVYALHAAKVNNIPVRIYHAHGASITKDWKLPLKLFCRSRLTANITERYTCGKAAAECYYGKEVVEKGYQYYDWNGDSTDASGNHVAVDKLIRNGTSCHDNNVMILCHDTQAKDTTVQALPAIIEHYKNLGYTFKGIDDATYAPHQSVNN